MKERESASPLLVALIVLAQFACTSLWFAGNAVVPELQAYLKLGPEAVGQVTSSVQFGFITGTLVFAMLGIADRFSPSRVFLISAILGAAANLGVVFLSGGLIPLLLLRFLTGFFLAGIYPVGMKIASDHHKRGLGLALGFLVGALVMGTAFPHFVRGFLQDVPWRTVFYTTTAMALAGGLVVGLLVPDGPFRKPVARPDFTAFFRVFAKKDFRAAAFGYFGHMWELYAFWAFVPVAVAAYEAMHPGQEWNIPLFTFAVIAIGGVTCALGGILSSRFGSGRVAFMALSLSGLCCLLSPLFYLLPPPFFGSLLIIWGMTVSPDSPQFSTLVATTAPEASKGTALTIVNSIGFAITIPSILLLGKAFKVLPVEYAFLVLVPGPLFGLIGTARLLKKEKN
ncbi:nitrate/nitrite transporter [Roseivirga sp. BDSF3-8]|uniref:MFS transporter n=1 Tax=Roseivirga sp. BDSF3-8 TaxID=3241598 RepID=UPI0035323EC4